jgi:uncharacterized protein (TIGR00369 family)
VQTDLSDSTKRLNATTDSSCYVCGQDNPRGLHLAFEVDHQSMRTVWTPDSTLEGFEGIVHGGIVSTVLDESMAKSVSALGIEALTAELRVRFRRPVIAGTSLHVSGWVTSRNKRLVSAEAQLTDHAGTELAHAWSSFLIIR